MITNFLIKRIFRVPAEIGVFIGHEQQIGSLIAILLSRRLWEEESIKTKLKSILTGKWYPSNEAIRSYSRTAFMEDFFGNSRDFGEELFKLMTWHNSRKWDLASLTEQDILRAKGLDALATMLRLRHRNLSSLVLNLELKTRVAEICYLSFPMVVKIPILSMRYAIDIHSQYAFNSIRKSGHPLAEDIIAYLYEIMCIQYKTAVSLHEYISVIHYTQTKKSDSLFINAELNAIISADIVFSYLKATVEKTIVLLGLIFEITNLDSKRNHKSKIESLKKGIPDKVKDLYYYDFLWNHIQSENLDELNSYRSGLLHKKGIADLQPHNYVDKNNTPEILKKIYSILIDQHAYNSAALIATFSLLTDQLVILDHPNIDIQEIINLSISE